MALEGLAGLGAPVNYYESMVPDFRREALMETQNRVGQQQVASQQMQNQQQLQENQRRQAFYGAIETATPEQLPALRRQFPEFAQNIQQELGIQDAEHANYVNKSLGRLSVALESGDPSQVAQAIQSGGPVWGSLGTNAEAIMGIVKSDPEKAKALARAAYMSTLPYDKQADIQNDQAKLAETIRSNRAGEGLQAQQIAVSRENSMRSARAGAGASTPASVREYQYFNSLTPEQQKTYLRVRGRPDTGGDNTVQLADGRTVSVSGKLHGAGANAFYEGTDDAGNMVRVPASAISAPPTSTASAQSYAMKKDIDSITNADSSQLDFMTGMTGGTGSPALGADVRSRITGNKEQRQLYNATRRIQGRMQNQGIAAAKDMGASGINTIPEARMYFQSMPQLDYSSPEAMQQSLRDIQEYTDRVNREHQINIGGKRQAVNQQTLPQQYGQTQAQAQQAAPAPQQQAGFSSLWGE